jgi:hypothetical protein
LWCTNTTRVLNRDNNKAKFGGKFNCLIFSTDLPDTSIGDTSTEDLDNSQATEQSITEEANVPDKEHEKTDPQCAASQQEHNTDAEVTETADNTGEKMEVCS